MYRRIVGSQALYCLALYNHVFAGICEKIFSAYKIRFLNFRIKKINYKIKITSNKKKIKSVISTNVFVFKKLYK